MSHKARWRVVTGKIGSCQRNVQLCPIADHGLA